VTVISQELLSVWSDPQDRCRCIPASERQKELNESYWDRYSEMHLAAPYDRQTRNIGNPPGTNILFVNTVETRGNAITQPQTHPIPKSFNGMGLMLGDGIVVVKYEQLLSTTAIHHSCPPEAGAIATIVASMESPNRSCLLLCSEGYATHGYH